MGAAALKLQSVSDRDAAHDPARIMGSAMLIRAAFEGRDPTPVFNALMARLAADPQDAAALLDLSIMLQGAGQRDKALEVQRQALELRRIYHQPIGRGDGQRILAIVTAGDLMANTPIDFLLEGSNADLWLYYVDAETANLDDLPDHDVAFVAVGESEANLPVLVNIERLLLHWPKPVVNFAPQRIAALTRDGVSAALAGEPSIVAPETVRVDRGTLDLLARGLIPVKMLLPDRNYPIIVRPVGTHAGEGMKKIGDGAALAGYLARFESMNFYLCPFIEYRSPDGLYRKQRIAFVDGKAFASHLAVSPHWMVHYLSAGMADSAARREEEASWMEGFDAAFAGRHARAFDVLCQRIGLDYFVIDCAELSDGRLLLFEADVAMIVHDMDPADRFAYKKPAMETLFRGFQGALERRVARPEAICTHTGKPAVYQRTPDDCLICCVAMLTGRSYEEVMAAARAGDPHFPAGGPMSHSAMRFVAHRFGFALLSGIYMAWDNPGIVGVVSPTTPNTAHAVFWDGEKIIDPGKSARVDRAYIDRFGLEFTQRAGDLRGIIMLEQQMAASAGAAISREP